MRARIASIRDRVDAVQENIVRFFREILAIPSTDGQIGEEDAQMFRTFP